MIESNEEYRQIKQKLTCLKIHSVHSLFELTNWILNKDNLFLLHSC